MKRIILITGIIASALFTSCQEDDFLDTPAVSSLEPSIIFSSTDLAKSAVDGIKDPFGDQNSYRGRWLPFYGLNTDVEWYNSSQTVSDASDLCTYDAKPNNSQMNTSSNGIPNNVWASMYSGIERANLAIQGLRAYGNPAPGNEMGYLLGEAITLRTIYYADLLRTWGDVPMRFEPVTGATIYLPKTNRDIIYKHLLADLDEAASLVPWPNKTTATQNVQRVNKAFVKGLRARLAMVASGYQQYPDGGGQGVIRRSNDPDLSVAKMYALALKECRDIITDGSSHLQTTITDGISQSPFEQIWRNYSREDLTAGGESLWEIPFASGRGRMLYTFAVKHNTFDQYYQFTGGASQSSVGLLPYVFFDYDAVDTRRNVTCVPYRYGNADANKIAKQELNPINAWAFGKYRYEWTKRIVQAQDDGFNKIYMRLAEVYLIAAEAANEVEGPASAAVYLKEIRKRAFKPADHAVKVDAYVAALTTKDAMLKAIIDEQKFEFAGEMERKQALIRWNLLKTNLDAAKVKMTNLKARTGEYATVPLDLYYKYVADEKGLLTKLDIYGLERGQTTPPAGYTLYPAATWNNLNDAKINSVYKSTVNPDYKQFWPIWQLFLDGSNGTLKNDYGY